MQHTEQKILWDNLEMLKWIRPVHFTRLAFVANTSFEKKKNIQENGASYFGSTIQS